MADLDEAAVFNSARKIDIRDQRDAYLREACAEDRSAYERIATLLRTYETDPDFLESPPVEIGPRVVDESTREGPGTVIGHYKLLERIGEGGFAVVYSAEQTEPIHRQVALKVIKLGMDTQQVIARFEAERQALALMDHPGIAKVYDAGTTEAGRPFFVMQLIHGDAITACCDRNRLPTDSRLRLFTEVCRAVQHAHQKGIIHRDIKPTNVLVGREDGRHVPRVIDFGVAKAIAQRLTEKTLYTNHCQIIGTPQYMSPEQAEFSDLDVDTRSDIYSLGVLLYELLTGATPFQAGELARMGYDEICHTIRHSEPLTPSKQLSTLGDAADNAAANRQIDLIGLHKLLRGDLDWIVMKALEKDRNRRYETADALALDIERHLAGEPIRARRISNVERVWRWSKRNRLVAALSISIAALVALMAITAPMVAWRQARLVDQTRQQLYVKDVALAYNAWQDGDLGHVRDLLNRYSTGSRCAHLRDFPWYYLAGLYQRSTTGFMQAEAFAVAPSTNQVAVAKSDNQIHLYDADTWREVGAWPWQRHWVRHFRFSRDGRYLALTDDAAQLSVWECASQQLLFTSSVDERKAAPHDWRGGDRPLCLAPDGSILATGGLDGQVTIWQTQTGKRLHQLTGHVAFVSAVAFSPDGRTLATGSFDNSLRLWDTSDWQPRTVLEDAFDARVYSIAYDPTGARFACGGWQDEVQVRDSNGQLLFSLPTWGSSLSFSPDGRFLAVGVILQGTAEVWELDEQNLVKRCRVGEGRASVEFLPDGDLLISSDNNLFRRDLAEFDEPQATRNKIVRSEMVTIGVSASGDLMAASYGQFAHDRGEGGVACWDLRQDKRRLLLEHDSTSVSRVAVSPAGDLIVAGGGPARGPGFVRVWNVDTGKLSVELPIEDAFVRTVAVSRAGERMAFIVVPRNGTRRVEVWNNLTGEPGLLWSREAEGKAAILAFSSRGDVLAVGRCGGESDRKERTAVITICDTATGQPLTVAAWDRAIMQLALSDDGRFLASIDWGGRIEVFDRHQQQIVLSEQTHKPAGTAVTFSPDGRTLATASSNPEVKFWHLPTLMHVATHKARDRVAELVFFPDGRTLAVGCLDRTIELWHVDRDMELLSIDDASAPR